MLTLLSAFLVIATPTLSNVYVDTEGQSMIAIPTANIGHPHDIAYHSKSKQLFVYSKLPDGEHITQWRQNGQALLDWHLPASFASYQPFTLTKGKMNLHLWDAARKKGLVATFSSMPSGPPPLKEEAEVLFSARDKRISEDIRTIMRRQKWLPLIRPGIHVLTTEPLINSFEPLMPLRDEHIAWTSDYAVVSYSSDDGAFFYLAVKQGGRDVHTHHDLFKHLLAALDWKDEVLTPVELYAINVTHTTAVYGLLNEQGDSKAAVVWIDVRKSNWRVQRTEAGYLARMPVSVND